MASSSGKRSRPRGPRKAAHLATIAAVTDDEYAALLASQDGHCALCPSTPKTRRLAVDHDHRTLKVRGLLCHRCNRALPSWVTVTWLLRVIEYLHHPPADQVGVS